LRHKEITTKEKEHRNFLKLTSKEACVAEKVGKEITKDNQSKENAM
jgi:hypothetical protein